MFQKFQSDNLAEVRGWAELYMAAHPNDPITESRGFTAYQNGQPYLRRWYVIPRNDVMNVYLHHFLLSDDPRATHDHRGDNTSWILRGEYLEHLGNGSNITRHEGDVVERRATDLHRVELVTGPVVSLFFIGPIVRDWGFMCPDGHWLPQQVFLKKVPGGNDLGPGCG